ncbi:MAG: sulfite exporter TauE/SafE family protein [Lysobacterales bacterium]|jgi:sulfite exporter TauE/SafE
MPIDWLSLGAALIAGLLGGVHCVAMCGGVAAGIAVSARAQTPGEAWRMAWRSNLGRIAGYTLAGLLVGGFGAGLIALARSDALLLGARMAVGAVLVLVGLRMLFPGAGFNLFAKPGAALWARLAPLQQRLLPANTGPRQFAMGLLWGWLPCGLSLTLLSAAWLSADALQGALIMASFGLGTLPLMLPLTYSGARALRWLQRPGARRAAAALVITSGLLTLAAPWLAQIPAVHGVLEALGCRTV